MRQRAANPESGFALLLVFAMAAILAISLYLEMPRVAFEAQRTREQLLIDRGEQYKRAIQLYMRKFSNTYPPSLEALENTNNMRFLRHRYKDPITGKDEWRLIHAGPGGVLTDSLTQKPPQVNKDKDKDNNQGASSSDQQQQQQPAQPAGIAFRRRPSDSGLQPGMQPPAVDPNQQPPAPGTVPLVPGRAQQYPPGFQAGIQPGQYPQGFQPQAGQPGIQIGQYPPGFQPQPGQPVIRPGQFPTGFPQPGQPGQPAIYPGFQPQPGQQPSPYPQTGQPSTGYPGRPLFPGQQPPAYQPQSGTSGPGTTPVPAIIMQQLTSPRPGGFPASGSAVTIGGGIAGVASTSEDEGIKVYNEHSHYNKWEFIYDPRKDLASPLGQMMNATVGFQQQQQQQQSPGTNPAANPGSNSLFTPTTPSKP